MSRRGNVLGLVRGRAGQVSASPAKENLADITSRVIAERYEAACLVQSWKTDNATVKVLRGLTCFCSFSRFDMFLSDI